LKSPTSKINTEIVGDDDEYNEYDAEGFHVATMVEIRGCERLRALRRERANFVNNGKS